MKKRVLIVFGTRPEAIKMAPLVAAFQKQENQIDLHVCVTAQHRQMLDNVLNFFGIKPSYDLNLMKPNQSLHEVTANVILGMDGVLDDCKPDYVLVHGDTTTSMATGLAAFYKGIKVAHVEAGLRTYQKYAPFPEELNRQITGRIADIHFAPTAKAAQNLLAEGVPKEHVMITGNTVIDALQYSIDVLKNYRDEEIEMLSKKLAQGKKIILVTGHRRENFGDGFIQICQALLHLAQTRDDIQIVYPVHMNPNVKDVILERLSNVPSIHLMPPLGYPAFIWLMEQSYLVLTDSGGIQEEAPGLGKPVLVMRDTTERPEAVEAGTVELVGTDEQKIEKAIKRLLDDQAHYRKMSTAVNPYGDGKSSGRIVEYILNQKL